MSADDPVTVLSEDESWSLLSNVLLGRSVTILGGQPEIFPVNFVTQRRTVLFRTAQGTKLFGAVMSGGVAFDSSAGVLIHIHDIFIPKDYLEEWVCRHMRLWNEQYLVEAFLSFNKEFKIIGALNLLKHRYPKELARCCPVLGDQIELLEPRSFWLRRV